MPNENPHPVDKVTTQLITFIHAVEQLVTTLLQTTARLFIKLFQFFTPVIAPAPTAALFGVNIYLAMVDQVTIPWIRSGIAITLALSLEGAGYLALKSAVRFYGLWRAERGRRDPLVIALTISIAYILIGIGSTLLLEEGGRDLRLLGITAFLIAPLVYTAAALWEELDLAAARRTQAHLHTVGQESQEAAIAAETRHFQQQLQLAQLAHQHQLEVQQLTAKTARSRLKLELSAQPGKVAPPPTPRVAAVPCSACGREFRNYRALNGHKRSCPAWNQQRQNGEPSPSLPAAKRS